MKFSKNKIIIAVFVITALAVVLWWGGNAPGMRGLEVNDNNTVVISEIKAEETKPTEKNYVSNLPSPSADGEQLKKNDALKAPTSPTPSSSPSPSPTEEISEQTDDAGKVENKLISLLPGYEGIEYSEENKMEINEETGNDEYNTEPVPNENPLPIEPQKAVISDKELTCTLKVSCSTVLDNLDWLSPDKAEIIPPDGIIFKEQTVTFFEGESVFNILLREMKRNKIHMEFRNTPIYNSIYIEGINNLYEFDCGELSGWMYKVNDRFPNYGCSRYSVKEGDKIEIIYTCQLGADVGGDYNNLGARE